MADTDNESYAKKCPCLREAGCCSRVIPYSLSSCGGPQESQPQYEHNFTAPPVAQQVVQQIIGAAYVDPNDPTKLYVSQPVAQPNIPVATAVPMQ